jgi:REP element-mobilizing transposase RayT
MPVLAYHLIFSAHGFWLPNDPRGSWSDFVRRWELFLFGAATKTNERQSLARRPHDRALRLKAKSAMKYAPVRFTGVQARAVATGLARAAREAGYIVYACSIMPDHVHMVVARCDRDAEKIVGHLKARATQELLGEKLHPFQDQITPAGRTPPCWARRCWKVFLFTTEEILRAIRYVNDNPPGTDEATELEVRPGM